MRRIIIIASTVLFALSHISVFGFVLNDLIPIECEEFAALSPGDVNVCEIESTCLFDLLEGTPPTDGTWYGPSGWSSSDMCGAFDPNVDPFGVYTYTIINSEGDFCIASINLIPSDIGLLSTLTICNQDSVNLFGISNPLGGNPATGTWTNENGDEIPNGILTGITPEFSGIYNYTFEDSNGCTVTGYVDITFGLTTTYPDTYIQVCTEQEGDFCPFELMDGNPPSTGHFVWYDANGGYLEFFPDYAFCMDYSLISEGDYFTYVLADEPCETQYINLNIEFVSPTESPNNTSASVCATGGIVDLNTLFDISDTTNVLWSDLVGGIEISNQFDPTYYAPGTNIQLSLSSGTGLCATEHLVSLTILSEDAYAGEDATIEICENAIPFNMFTETGGMPQPGGVWTGPDGNPVGLFYNPGTSIPGNYTYNIVSSCGSDSAVLTILENEAPVVPNNSTILVCMSLGEINLDTAFTVDVSSAGQWTDPNGNFIGASINTETALEGAYTYTLDNGLCTASCVLQLNIANPPNAGPDVTLDFCGDGSPILLMNHLSPFADVNGLFSNSDLITLVPANEGTYTYNAYSPGCSPDIAFYTVNINEELVISNLSENCNPTGTAYTVSFNILGVPPFNVDGVVSGSTYTSNPIPEGTPYNFAISDGSGCADVSISGTASNCGCEVAYATIEAASDTVCEGSCTSIVLQLPGEAPFNVIYSDGVSDISLLGINSGHIVDVCPSESTTYSLVSVSNPTCATTNISNQFVSVDVLSLAASSAGPNTTLELCLNGYQINLYNHLDSAASFPGSFDTPFIMAEESAAGIYSYISNNGYCPADTAEYEVSFLDLPEISDVQVTCDPTNPNTYIIEASVSGGLPPYASTEGAFNNGLFTSISYPIDSLNFGFLISDDNGCSSYVYGTVVDSDDDGICDEGEIVGCQDPAASNYDPEATDSGFCTYTQPGPTIFNISLNPNGSGLNGGRPDGTDTTSSKYQNEKPNWNFNVYPNPWNGDGQIQIQISGNAESSSKLEIYDLTGRLIFNNTMIGKDQTQFTIPLSNSLDSGTYLISLTNNSERKSQLLIINN